MLDPFLDYHSSVPSGVRLEVITDCSMLEFDVELQHMVLPGLPSKGSAFDIIVDGELREPVWTKIERLILLDVTTRELALQPPNPVTLRFELGAATVERRIEIWFPASTAVKLMGVRITDGASLRPAPSTRPIWIHYGSSISQCSEVV